jgi:lysyl-tRNA synthetase class 2
LRIAPELWLKRLVVGGFERVFEMGRVFRNEGVSPRHNPEFTMLEIYCAYWNYEDMMTFTEELTAGVAMDVLGTTEVEYQGRPFSFAAPWPRRTMAELASEAVGEEVSVHTPRATWRRCSKTAASTCTPRGEAGALPRGTLRSDGRGIAVESDFRDGLPRRDLATRSSTPERPGPRGAIRVLRRGSRTLQRLLGTDRSRRSACAFEDQARLAAAGEPETMHIDEDYIKALEWGLPPTAGLGLGIDRLAMLIADESNIREVIAFPTLKPLGD